MSKKKKKQTNIGFWTQVILIQKSIVTWIIIKNSLTSGNLFIFFRVKFSVKWKYKKNERNKSHSSIARLFRLYCDQNHIHIVPLTIA